MSWFDEQLKLRKEKDDESFEAALSDIAGAAMGKKIVRSLDENGIARSAVDEIIRYYGFEEKDDGRQLRAESIDEQIEYRLSPFGVFHRKVRLDKGWYRRAVGPMIGTLKEGGAVALVPGKISGYSIVDLSTGERRRVTRKTEKTLDDGAVCFYKPLAQRPLKISDLLLFAVQTMNVSDVLMYVGMAALMSVVGLISPVITKMLFGPVLGSGSVAMLAAIVGFMLCYTLCRLLMSAYSSFAESRIMTKQKIYVQAAVMNRLVNLPASFFRDYSSGELNRRAAYVQSLCSVIMSSIGATGITSVFSLIYIGQIFSFAPSLVVPSLMITLATVLLSTVATFMQMKITKRLMETSSKTAGTAYATIRGIQKIKLAGAEKRMFSRWARSYAKDVSLEYDQPVFLDLSGSISLAVSLLGTLVLYYLSVKSGVSVSDYYAFDAAYGVISGAFASFSSIAVTIAEIKPTLEMARPIMEAVPEVSEGKQLVSSLSGSIELSHVSFRYDETMPYVIDDMSLTIRPGEYIAVAGTTGCGKSTLMRLLLGFEKPQKGSIYYDRKDITKLDLRSLRRSIGAVMQDDKIFPGDIYSNIVIAAPQLSLDEAWQAAQTASIAEDIHNMPMGMNTVLSEGQGGISGGQRQRLLIARALAPKPKILILDEATSALDNITQKKISEAVDGLHITRIVIAHRLSTIQHADRILFMDKGRIVEEGTYDELIAKNGLFAELISRQRLDTDEN